MMQVRNNNQWSIASTRLTMTALFTICLLVQIPRMVRFLTIILWEGLWGAGTGIPSLYFVGIFRLRRLHFCHCCAMLGKSKSGKEGTRDAQERLDLPCFHGAVVCGAASAGHRGAGGRAAGTERGSARGRHAAGYPARIIGIGLPACGWDKVAGSGRPQQPG